MLNEQTDKQKESFEKTQHTTKQEESSLLLINLKSQPSGVGVSQSQGTRMDLYTP